MKAKMFFALTFAIALQISNSLKANTNLDAAAAISVAAANKILIVKLDISKAQDVTINIEDANGNIFYTETSQISTDIVKRFDLNNLENGAYLLVVKKGGARIVQPIDVHFDKVIPSEKRAVSALPIVRLNEKTLDVTVSAKKTANFDIKIYDNVGTLLFEANFTELGLRRFDLSKLPQGSYTVVADEETYNIALK